MRGPQKRRLADRVIGKPPYGFIGCWKDMRQQSGLARLSATEQVHDGQQNHGAEERDEQRSDAEVALIDGAGAEQRREQPTAEKSTDKTDEEEQQHALLRIGSHDQAGQPSKNAAHNDPDKKVHDFLLFNREDINIMSTA